MPKQIYALLIGIDEYPIERHWLSGCVNDVMNLKTYFETHFNTTDFQFHPKLLLNSEATRQNIIHSFHHFDSAKDGDVCLLHFSGHGAESPAPAALWHLEPNKKVQSILCYDSRLENGRDLIDKELSYLIYNATQGKNIHFVTIMDCCHAGTNTRLQVKKVRMAEAADRLVPIEEYLGFSECEEVEPKRFTPPRGRHIQLAAAKSNELAKEVFAEYQNTGVFTYALLDTLKKNGNNLSYSALIERVNLRVRNLVRQQSPQIDAVQTADKSLNFLTGEPVSQLAHYLITYDNEMGWVVNAGALHGLQKGDELQCKENNQALIITEVLPACSKVNVKTQDFDTQVTYNAIVVKRQLAKTKLAFVAESDPRAVSIFKAIFERQGSELLELTDAPQNAPYQIHTQAQQFKLTLADDERPIFLPVKGFTATAASDFINKLELVAKWQRLLELGNPATSLPEETLELTCWRLTKAGKHEDGSPAEIINHQEVIELPYLFENGKWHQPAFRLKLRNNSRRTLWVSALYLGEDFSIQNGLLPKVELEAGSEVWLTDAEGDYAHRSIMTMINDLLWKKGITQSLEFIKIIVSTEEIKTDHFEQDGFYDQMLSPSRALSRRSAAEKPDWRTYELKIRTTRPLLPQIINAQKPYTALGIRIEAYEGFEAQVRLANVEETSLALQQELNPYFVNNQFLTPFEFSDGLNDTPGLSVIELLETRIDSLGMPLKITFMNSTSNNITPLQYNITRKCFLVLQYEIIGNTLLINKLPEKSPSFFGNSSSKIFFNI